MFASGDALPYQQQVPGTWMRKKEVRAHGSSGSLLATRNCYMVLTYDTKILAYLLLRSLDNKFPCKFETGVLLCPFLMGLVLTIIIPVSLECNIKL